MIIVGGDRMRHYECVRQDGQKDCGICSLLTIVKSYGGDISKEYLRTITKTSKNGVNAFYLLEAGKILGFQVQGIKGDFRKLQKRQLPCIAHIIVNQSYAHFIVIHEINFEKEFLIVADPAIGIRTISFPEFERLSTKHYLLFEPKQKICLLKKNKMFTKKFIQFLKMKQKQIIVIFCLSLLFTFLQIFFSFSFQIIVENGILFPSKTNLYFFFLFFVMALFLRESVNYIRKKLVFWFEKQIDDFLFHLFYQHLVSLPYFYFKNRTTGEVLAKIQDLHEIESIASQFLLTLFLDLTLFFCCLIGLYLISNSLFIIYLFGFFLLIIIYLFGKSFFVDKVSNINRTASIFSSSLTESIQGMATIKNMQLENLKENEIVHVNRMFLEGKKSTQILVSKLQLLEEIILGSIFLIILFIGSTYVLENKISYLQLFSFQNLVLYANLSIRNILSFYYQYQSLHIIFERIEEVMNYPTEQLQLDTKYVGRKINGLIEFKKLNYSYNKSNLLFENYNLLIPKAAKVLIYGQSGSGKSTLIRLLARYLDPPNKSIFIDGKDIVDYSLLELRNHLSIISQEEILFADSIYQNIVLDRDISYDEFLKIAKICKVDFIKEKSSLGYYFLIEENGFNLSGGERQRILLARALSKKADIYLLDESFSQIDIKTERQILKEIFQNYSDKTFLVVSHRLSNQDLYTMKIKIGRSYL